MIIDIGGDKMNQVNILPADTYTVINKTIIKSVKTAIILNLFLFLFI